MNQRRLLVVRPRAFDGLMSLERNIRLDSPQNADEFLERVVDVVNSFEHFAERFPIWHGRYRYARSTVVAPARIVYRVTARTVTILAVEPATADNT